MYLNVSKNYYNIIILYLVYDLYFNDIKILVIVLANVVLLTFVFYFFTSKYKIPNYPIFICIFTLILSIIWIWFSANILIELLIAISKLINIPDSFLGITLLTYGNSLPDLMLNLSLVKIGYGEMALSGSITGPLFNLLIGLGLPLIKLIIKFGKIEIDFFNRNNIVSIICLGLSIGDLIILGLLAKSVNYKLNMRIAIVSFIIYFIFFVLGCLLVFFIK